MKNKTVYNLTLAALFLALGQILPFITAQIQSIGMMLLPMHLPVFLCGMICGPVYGLIVGFIAPLLRFALFSMPPLFPTGISMAFELGTYGLISGLLCRKLSTESIIKLYLVLIVSMIAGRLVWALITAILFGMSAQPVSFAYLWHAGFLSGIPGIILQLVLIPLLVYALAQHQRKRYRNAG